MSDEDVPTWRFSLFTRGSFVRAKGWRDERPGRTKSTKAISESEQWPPTSHPFPTINEIRCSLSSRESSSLLSK